MLHITSELIFWNYIVLSRQDKVYLGYNLNEFTSSRNETIIRKLIWKLKNLSLWIMDIQ